MPSSNVAFNVTDRDTAWSFPSDIPAPSRDDLDASLNVLTRRLEALRVFAGDAIAAPIIGDLNLVRADISNLRNAHDALSRDVKQAVAELRGLDLAVVPSGSAHGVASILAQRIRDLEAQKRFLQSKRDLDVRMIADANAQTAASLAGVRSLEKDIDRWVSRGMISRRTADAAIERSNKVSADQYGQLRPAVIDGEPQR